ncbi:MAG TPA: DoxX family membrane protein [Acidobacteriaceae bacterium]|nr:DoxX family membrane protein [Acidobacteriaceae bacterium]
MNSIESGMENSTVSISAVPISAVSIPIDQRIAYLLLRVIAGMDFFGHGFARIFTGTHLGGFAHWMVGDMAKAPLPASLVLVIGYVVPWVELAVGLMLLFGVGVRFALVTALLLMLLLMFGITMKQDWTVAGQQLLYSLVLAVLLFGRERLDVSWSGLLHRR